MELDALHQIVDDVRAAGATLVVISPQSPEHSRELIEGKQYAFPLLHDARQLHAGRCGLVHELPADLQEIYTGFGVDLPSVNEEDAWRLPLPARYVVDRHGLIRSAEVNVDYTCRPEPSDTLAVLRGLTDLTSAE